MANSGYLFWKTSLQKDISEESKKARCLKNQKTIISCFIVKIFLRFSIFIHEIRFWNFSGSDVMKILEDMLI